MSGCAIALRNIALGLEPDAVRELMEAAEMLEAQEGALTCAHRQLRSATELDFAYVDLIVRHVHSAIDWLETAMPAPTIAPGAQS